MYASGHIVRAGARDVGDFMRGLDEKDADEHVATLAWRGRRMLRWREMRDAVRLGRERITRFDGRLSGGALRFVLFGRAERGGGRCLIGTTRATFKTGTLAFAKSRGLRFVLRLFHTRAIHRRVRGVGLRLRKRLFVRRCVVRVLCWFCTRRVRFAEFGAATIVFIGGRNGGSVGRARFVQARRLGGDGSQCAAPHARREREKNAGDESQSSHKLAGINLSDFFAACA